MTNNDINLERLQTVSSELEAAWQRRTDAAEAYIVAAKNVVEQVSTEPGALKAYISLRMKDRIDTIQREVEQLTLLLETIGQ